MTGTLYLIPVTLGGELSKVIPSYNITVINSLRYFVCEEGKSARQFLKQAGITRPLQEMVFYELNEHSKAEEINELIKPLVEGQHVGLMSEAGCPGVADPGAALVKLAHRKGIKVVPLTGPSSILLALMASGFNGQNFAFNGYLPKEKSQRIKRIRELEKLTFTQLQTQLFIETPYRNIQLLEELTTILSPATLILLACNISLDDEFIKVLPAGEWKKLKPDIHKKPCMFGIYR